MLYYSNFEGYAQTKQFSFTDHRGPHTRARAFDMSATYPDNVILETGGLSEIPAAPGAKIPTPHCGVIYLRIENGVVMEARKVSDFWRPNEVGDEIPAEGFAHNKVRIYAIENGTCYTHDTDGNEGPAFPVRQFPTLETV